MATAIKLKHIWLSSAINPPGFNSSQPASGIHAASFDGEKYELYKVGSEVWIVKDKDAVSVPLSTCKRLEYYKLEDTPVERAREETAPPRPVGRPPKAVSNG